MRGRQNKLRSLYNERKEIALLKDFLLLLLAYVTTDFYIFVRVNNFLSVGLVFPVKLHCRSARDVGAAVMQ